MKSVKFTSNPFIRSTLNVAHAAMNNIVNTFYDSEHEDLLKKAAESLYRLGWTLEEYQESNKPGRLRRRHNDKRNTGSST
jgi:hypothetical protein